MDSDTGKVITSFWKRDDALDLSSEMNEQLQYRGESRRYAARWM